MPSDITEILNCEIHYLSAVKYDPATTDIFIRVNMNLPRARGGGLKALIY
jgi:hypothetical protein